MERSSLAGPKKVLRAPALRRGRDVTPISEKVKLERVLGFTVSSNTSLDCDPQTGVIAYPAGCVIVLFNPRKNKQNHILNASKKTITTLAFSWDGRYLATGECGHQPHVRVWDVQDCSQVAEFAGHKYGINCVSFSPNLKYVVSVGSQHDMIVNVWDWRNNVKVASNKVSSKVKAISFASSGNYFVTVGNRHVKFWYLEYSRSTKYKLEPVPLMGRSAILGDQRNNYFCGVMCGRGQMAESTYAITKSGLLCEFNSRRLLDKWVELRTTSANCISVGEDLIFIGCAEGVVRCFNPLSLHFICTLPRPHYLGVDVAKRLTKSDVSSPPSNVKYPDTVAVALDEVNKKVTCIYSDHSMYVWDIHDVKKVGKSHSFLYHSACIWGVETYPPVSDGSKPVFPPGTFLTCSSDDTIRLWNLETNINRDATFQRNMFSNELLKMIYVDPELTYLCDIDFNPAGSSDKVDTTYDGKNGVRCLKISPDGHHLAAGDRSGNIRIYEVQRLEELCKIEAHDSEVLCLEYSKPYAGKRYLASASRDRLIHVFDVDEDYKFQQTFDDHSSSITAVRFVMCNQQLQMISCGADKSIIFRRAQLNPQISFIREHHVVGKTTLYDMEVDVQQRCVLTACQDRNIRVYNVSNGKNNRCFRGSQGEDGTLIKVVLDNSGTYLATSCTDKSLYLYDYYSGECVATMFGHSELVTGLKFANNGKHLISVSGDGCIFMWRLPQEMTRAIMSKQVHLDVPLPSVWQDGRGNTVAIAKPVQAVEPDMEKAEHAESMVDEVEENSPGYRFSMGPLPLWAKKQMLDELSPSSLNANQLPSAPMQPRGRWAQRMEGQGIVVKSYPQNESIIPYPQFMQGGPQEKNELGSLQRTPSKQNLLGDGLDFSPHAESLREIHTGDQDLLKMGGNSRITTLRGSEFGHHHHQQSLMTNNNNNQMANNNNNVNNNSILSRVRHPTDSSTTSSLHMDDADAEDERSDTETGEGAEVVYYPQPDDGMEISSSTFKVCASGENELQEARRRLRKVPRSEKLLNDLPSISIPDLNDLNSDDDDSGTPVDGERTFPNSFSMSTENLDRLGQREKFMKSNYESLERDPVDVVLLRKGATDTASSPNYMQRHSISAKFLAKTTVSSGPKSLGSPSKHAQQQQQEAHLRRREELAKALNDTRRKLENVGWRSSSLSGSRSIGDLHNISDKEASERSFLQSLGVESMRRATSLCDLSTPVSSRRRQLPSTPAGHESPAPLWDQAKDGNNSSSSSSGKPLPPTQKPPPIPRNKLAPVSGHSPGNKTPTSGLSSNLARSASIGALDTPNLFGTVHKVPSMQTLEKRMSKGGTPSQQQQGLWGSPMSKAISTSSIHLSGRASAPPVSRRLPLYNNNNNSDSSSPDLSPTDPNVSFVQASNPLLIRSRTPSASGLARSKEPIPGIRSLGDSSSPIRSRPMSVEPLWSKSERDLSWVGRDDSPTKSVVRIKVEPMTNQVDTLAARRGSLDRSSMQFSDEVRNLDDSATAPLTHELCEQVAEELKRVTAYAMQIFQRITMDMELAPSDKSSMTNTLAQAVWQAQQNLRPAVPPMPLWSQAGAGATSATDTAILGSAKRTTTTVMSSEVLHHQQHHREEQVVMRKSSASAAMTALAGGASATSSASDASIQPEVMQFLQQYSDRLLSMVEQRMMNKADQGSTKGSG